MKDKQCTKCGEIKLTSEFKQVKCNKSGIDSQCISCRDEYYQANKEKIKLRVTEWAKNNKVKRNTTEKKYRDNNKEKCKIAVKLWSDHNEDRIKATRKEYKKRNKNVVDLKDAEYRENNREAINSRNRGYYKNNIKKEKVRSKKYRDNHKKEISLRTKEYKSKNKHKGVLYTNARRALKLNATPLWADIELIEFFYKKAQHLRAQGIDVHVDHIVPLSNNIVCGLHCVDNLQILPAHINLSKSNKHYA